jgi:hypothetical protein
MHATTEQLLSLRDSQPVEAGVAAHVAACALCRRRLAACERTRERLRAMPAIDPPGDLWRTVAVGAISASRRPRPRWPVLVGFAASFALGVAVILRMGATPDEGPAPGSTTDLIASTPAPVSSVNGTSKAELLAASQRIEAVLRAMPAAPRVTRASTALTIAELQDRIFEIDAALNDRQLDPVTEQALWQQRVRLMDTLMQVRYAQLTDAR